MAERRKQGELERAVRRDLHTLGKAAVAGRATLVFIAVKLATPVDGELSLAVRERFADGNGAGVEAALALTLARQVEAGATSSAGRLMSLIRDRYAVATARAEELEAVWLEAISGPRPHTFCARAATGRRSRPGLGSSRADRLRRRVWGG